MDSVITIVNGLVRATARTSLAPQAWSAPAA